MDMNMGIHLRTIIFAKAEVYYPDNLYFHNKIKEHDSAQLLKAEDK